MPKTDRLAGLTEEENALLDGCRRTLEQDTQPLPTTEKGVVADLTIEALESLAASRASEARKKKLLEKAKQYIQDDISGMPFDEEQVRQLEQRGKDIYAALAAELEGGE